MNNQWLQIRLNSRFKSVCQKVEIYIRVSTSLSFYDLSSNILSYDNNTLHPMYKRFVFSKRVIIEKSAVCCGCRLCELHFWTYLYVHSIQTIGNCDDKRFSRFLLVHSKYNARLTLYEIFKFQKPKSFICFTRVFQNLHNCYK